MAYRYFFINIFSLMSRKIAPTLVVNKVDKANNPNSSITSINNSYLYEGYTGNEETGSKCHHCHKSGKGSLMPACQCFGRVYHGECLKKWINKQMKNPDVSMKYDDQEYQIQCEGCKFAIKFKATPRTRCKNTSEVCSYCTMHKGFTFGMVILFGMLLGCLLYLTLLALNIIKVCDCNLAKSTLMIALAVGSFFILLIALCCLLDCLRASEYKIQTLYDRNGCSRRSSRSGRSGNSIRSGRDRTSNRHKLKIQTLE